MNLDAIFSEYSMRVKTTRTTYMGEVIYDNGFHEVVNILRSNYRYVRFTYEPKFKDMTFFKLYIVGLADTIFETPIYIDCRFNSETMSWLFYDASYDIQINIRKLFRFLNDSVANDVENAYVLALVAYNTYDRLRKKHKYGE